MRLSGHWSRAASSNGRPTITARTIVRSVGALALVASAACQDVDPTSPPTHFTPGNAARVLTGATGTDLFPTADPGNFQSEGFALALNAVGQVTGSWHPASMPSSDARVFRWSAATGAVVVSGCCGGDQVGIDINDAGVITGRSWAVGSIDATRAFRATANTIVNLPTFANASNIDANSLGVAINNAGQIAGWAEQGNGTPRHAVMWTANDVLVDLGTLGGTTSTPTGLNNKGQVVGSSGVSNAATHAFLWTQTDGMEDITNIAGVPEVRGLNDNLQTVTGTSGYGPRQGPMPRLVQLVVTSAPNQPPVASFTVNCVGQSSPNQCAFDASASRDDKGIVSYKWDWGNGRAETKSGPTTRNTWASPGVYTVTLTVSDAGGLTGTASKQITIGTPANQSPAATISAPRSGLQILQGQNVDFSGTGADPEDGQLSGASLVWRSSIDGVIGTGNAFTRNDLSVGTHTITLTVTDSKGATGTATTAVEIYAYDPPPKPSFTWTCAGQVYPHQCSFDASASTDDKGIVSYQWDWGNGRTETKTRPIARNTWASAGTYTVTLYVSDGNTTVGRSQQVVVP
jgi:probable HAF family extracellular repeat protein